MSPASSPAQAPVPGNRKAAARISWVWVLPAAAVIILILALSLLAQFRPRWHIPASPTPTANLPTVTGTNTPGPQATAVPNQTTYIVMPGDTLASIAEWFNLPPEAIMEANHLTSTGEIYPGQSLVIPHLPQATATPTPSPLPASPK